MHLNSWERVSLKCRIIQAITLFHNDEDKGIACICRWNVLEYDAAVLIIIAVNLFT